MVLSSSLSSSFISFSSSPFWLPSFLLIFRSLWHPFVHSCFPFFVSTLLPVSVLQSFLLLPPSYLPSSFPSSVCSSFLSYSYLYLHPLSLSTCLFLSSCCYCSWWTPIVILHPSSYPFSLPFPCPHQALLSVTFFPYLPLPLDLHLLLLTLLICYHSEVTCSPLCYFLLGTYGSNLRLNGDIFLSTDAGMNWHMVLHND